jgi:hypothetical protein
VSPFGPVVTEGLIGKNIFGIGYVFIMEEVGEVFKIKIGVCIQ